VRCRRRCGCDVRQRSFSDVTPVTAGSIASWDDGADIVIAGYGVAGAAAAVEAARAGAEVLVLERSGSWGGAAAMAGFIYLGGGTVPRH
jgi:3-oxo-5alpha-steroid 4-dehydrogenase